MVLSAHAKNRLIERWGLTEKEILGAQSYFTNNMMYTTIDPGKAKIREICFHGHTIQGIIKNNTIISCVPPTMMQSLDEVLIVNLENEKAQLRDENVKLRTFNGTLRGNLSDLRKGSFINRLKNMYFAMFTDKYINIVNELKLNKVKRGKTIDGKE